MSLLTVHAKVDANDYGQVENSSTLFSTIGAISFGAAFGGVPHFDERNIKVGTAGYGSSDLFAPALTDLSEFTGVYGNDGSIVASGGILSVDNDSAADHFGYLALPPALVDIYVQFDLRVRDGDVFPDYHDIWDDVATAAADGTQIDGIFNNPFDVAWGLSIVYAGGVEFGVGATVDVWTTINLHWSFSDAPPGVAPFHIAS